MPVNYQLGKIYKIADNTNDSVYIGSTCEPTLARRLAKHVNNYKSYLNGKNDYITSYDILENNDYNIVLIEASPCNSKDELLARERYFIESIDCINKNIPGRTRKEYNKQYAIDHAEEISQKQKEYREKNEATLKIKESIYREVNKINRKEKGSQIFECECGSKCRHNEKARHFKSLKHTEWIDQFV